MIAIRCILLCALLSAPAFGAAAERGGTPAVHCDSAALRSGFADLDRAADILWCRTDCRRIDSLRLSAMDIVQAYADECPAEEFKRYYAETDAAAAEATERESAILTFHRAAFERVLEQIRTVQVERGRTMIWHVYNMGYVVKTAATCFAVDIKHKYAVGLVPYIDFLLITHRHGDHYTDALNRAMAAAGKPVVSNFIDNEYKVGGKRRFRFGEVRITATLTDHNDKLPLFVAAYEIDCGRSGGHCRILHAGDTRNAAQLQPEGEIDIFIPHLAVGLDIQAVLDHCRPHTVLLSHLLELGHAVDKWRWSYRYGIGCCDRLKHDDLRLPVWGEAIVWPERSGVR